MTRDDLHGLGNDLDNLRLLLGDVFADDDTSDKDRIASVGFIDNLLKLVVSHDGQSINGFVTGSLTIRQSQATSDGLFNQRARIGFAERDDGVEVGYVPAFFEHVDVNDDFDGVRGVFDRQQLLDDIILFFSLGLGVNRNDFAFVGTVKKVLRLNRCHQRIGVLGVFGNDQHEWLDTFDAVLS